MNMSKVFNFISENNIQPAELFELVEKVKGLDLDDEASIRKVIRDVAKLAHKNVDRYQEDKIVAEIRQNGINDNLFNLIK